MVYCHFGVNLKINKQNMRFKTLKSSFIKLFKKIRKKKYIKLNIENIRLEYLKLIQNNFDKIYLIQKLSNFKFTYSKIVFCTKPCLIEDGESFLIYKFYENTANRFKVILCCHTVNSYFDMDIDNAPIDILKSFYEEQLEFINETKSGINLLKEEF